MAYLTNIGTRIDLVGRHGTLLGPYEVQFIVNETSEPVDFSAYTFESGIKDEKGDSFTYEFLDILPSDLAQGKIIFVLTSENSLALPEKYENVWYYFINLVAGPEKIPLLFGNLEMRAG